MTSQPQVTDNVAINELIFLENHINSLIERIKHNGEYAETKKEKAQVITEVQILERLLEYAHERKKILQMVQNNNA
jgi:hypothetical protein